MTIGTYSFSAMLQLPIMTTSIDGMGDKLRKLREPRWTSQQKFLDFVEETYGMSIHQTSLSAFERGDKRPSVETLTILAQALETNTDYLLGLTDDDKPHGKLDDQVVVTVEDANERVMLQDALEMLVRATKEDKEYIIGLIRRLSPKKPRIIGGE